MAQPDIKAIIWDMGGVILRSEDPHPREELARQFGKTSRELSGIVFNGEASAQATIGKITDRELWQQVAIELGVSTSKIDDLSRQFFAGDRIDEQLISTIRALKAEYKTGLLSNAWIDARKTLTERFNIMDAFDAAIFSAEVGMAKPDVRIYELTVRMLGVQPGQAIFIDDFPENITGAQAAGLYGIQFKTAVQTLADLRKLNVRWKDDLIQS